tara:strand:- start:3439 stop:4557 length:1119 start_codon:yes stop_codon:yes gene_type:complete
MSLNNIIRNTLNEQLGGGGECETSTCNCVSTVLNLGYYQPNFPTNGLTWEENCWNDYGNVMGNNQTNNCTKVTCKPNQGCVNIPYSDPDWASTPFVGCSAMADCQAQHPNGCAPIDYYDCTSATGHQCGVVSYSTSYTNLTSCQTAFPNGCAPVDNYDCTNGTGNVCGLVSYQTSYQTLSSCQSAFPNGCQETCCDMWVCVNGGKFNKCCREITLCTLQGHSSPWSSGPGGFPWHLVESSSVPQKEFKKILMEAPWMCNMNWTSYFGIWLALTKQECMDGPSWSGVGPAAGHPGCGPCYIQADIDKTKFADDFEMSEFDPNTSNDILKGKDAEEALMKWKEEGRVKRVNEDFYKDITKLVEEIYITKNLLKS